MPFQAPGVFKDLLTEKARDEAQPATSSSSDESSDGKGDKEVLFREINKFGIGGRQKNLQIASMFHRLYFCWNFLGLRWMLLMDSQK